MHSSRERRGRSLAKALQHGSIPALTDFEQAEAYYSTLFHELAHSTGHPTRLERSTVSDACPFGTTNYSKEELTAEMAAAFLCGHAGIENRTIDNSAAYISNWWSRLSEDRKLLIYAASAAQKAADYIMGDTARSPDQPGDSPVVSVPERRCRQPQQRSGRWRA